MRGNLMLFVLGLAWLGGSLVVEVNAQDTLPKFTENSISYSLSDNESTGPEPNQATAAGLTSPASTTRPIIPVTWASANSHYRRLYFEEKLLERNGLTDGPKRASVRSGIQFFARAAAFPIYVWKYRPNQIQSPYAMGRAGSEANR